MKKDFDQNKLLLWGLTDENSNEEIVERVFEYVKNYPDIPTATINHNQPECRIIGYDRLSDGCIYFMTSKGKPVYKQLQANNQIVMNTMVEDCFFLRIHGWVEELGKGEVWDEFFSLNPGTLKMYRNNLDIIALYKVAKGEGEIFTLCDADKVKRLRFNFGGAEKIPMTYYINREECIGCNACYDSCAEESIVINEDGTCSIKDFECDGCGICYTKCPKAGEALINRMETEKGYYE